jgi:hypothetical protein
MFRNRSFVIAMTATLVLASSSIIAPASAKPKAPKGGAPAAGADAGEKPPFQDWKKVLKDAETKPGFLTLHKKRETLYLEIKEDQLGKPFLGIFSFARGIGSNFLLGGLPLNDRLLEFERVGDRVLVLEKNSRFVSNGDGAFDKARDLSYGHSVLASLKIESVHDSSKALLVDFTPFVVSDLTDLSEAMRFAINKSVRFDKDRSALGSTKNFPENTEVEALLTYSPNDRQNYGLPTVSDDRYIPITVHYSFSKLPENPMMPRLADERTGYFLTAVKDFTRDTEDHYWRRFINRWRLEKKDPNAALSEPVKPIVFYIDHTIPAKYRPYIKEGIENWNKAFEAAGFKNAILAKDPPADDPDWDPEDVRYSTIRWIVSSEPSFGAIGPSRVDPRTGEILDADILFEGSIVQRRLQVFRRISPDAVAEGIQPEMKAWPSFLDPRFRCDAPLGIAQGAQLAHVGMLANGSIPPGAPLPEKFVGEMLIHVTLHEVGHTLGLTHNFRSSTSTPWDKLHDREWTNANGLTSSVMDYATPNISYEPSKQGEYYGVTAGNADLWMIRYGYAPSGAADVDADHAFARKIADESTKPGHEYSNDADTYPAEALDPRTNIWDLGDDPLRFGRERAAWVAGLWKDPKLEERILGTSGSYSTLRGTMDDLLGQYGIALGMGIKYIGGQYHQRVVRGQNVEPLTPVPAAKQREAFEFIAQRGFGPDAFKLAPTLLNRLAPDRWNHWGMPNAWGQGGARVDYDLTEKTLAIQTALVNALTAPKLLARLREGESRTAEPFRMGELFDRMTRTLWGEVGGESTAGLKALDAPGTRREVQRVYVDRLATLVVAPPPGRRSATAGARRPALRTTRGRWRGSSCRGSTAGRPARWPPASPSATTCALTCSRPAPASSARSTPSVRSPSAPAAPAARSRRRSPSENAGSFEGGPVRAALVVEDAASIPLLRAAGAV